MPVFYEQSLWILQYFPLISSDFHHGLLVDVTVTFVPVWPIHHRSLHGVSQLILAGEWVVLPNQETVAPGDKRVLFYGTNQRRADELAAHLEGFQKRLPPGVEVKINSAQFSWMHQPG
jgi:hypothetical protein